MLQRKLLFVNILIITLTLAVITFSAVHELRALLYHENTLSYNNLILEDCSRLQEIFNSSEDKLLTICSNRSLQALLEKEEYDYKQIDDLLNTLRMAADVENIIVYPVKDGDVYYPNGLNGYYYRLENGLERFDTGYGYTWTCRPDNEDCIRVSRPMFSLQDLSRIIAVVSVDYAMPSIVDMVYSFGTQENMTGKMFFLDENNQYILPYHLKGKMQLKEDSEEFISSESLLSADDTYTLVHSFKNNNWKLVAMVEGSAFYQDSSQRIGLLIGATVFLEMIGILLTIYFTKRLTKPIISLSHEINENAISESYRKIEVPEHLTDEVKNLYYSYNRLVDEVNNSIHNIQDFSKKEVENQFMLLQAQIDPHFLYNTLNTVSWMAANHQDEDIQKLVIDLVNLFRISLNNGKKTVTVEKEIELVRSYLGIMKYRYPGRYEDVYEIDENTRDLIIIKQVLQPLAENALTHGFLESDQKGIIRIESHLEKEYVILSVSNNGNPADLDKIDKILHNDEQLKEKHYGIRNVNERLIMYYGEENGLHYEIKENETRVEIRIPLQKMKEELWLEQ